MLEQENENHVMVYMGTARLKSKQGNTTNLNIFFSMENETELLRCPQHTAYEEDAPPTEVPRQLSWLGRIEVIQGKDNQSN